MQFEIVRQRLMRWLPVFRASLELMFEIGEGIFQIGPFFRAGISIHKMLAIGWSDRADASGLHYTG